MFEKVSRLHIDKVADRIAGAIVDLAYDHSEEEPKVAVEVLIGHGVCSIMIESSVNFNATQINEIVERIAGKQFRLELRTVPQDKYLSKNQEGKMRCGDNGIFKAVRTSEEEKILSNFAKYIYNNVIKSDGKYLIDKDNIVICQSGINSEEMLKKAVSYFTNYDYNIKVNPLGDWNFDLNNDTGVTGRKIGSDLGRGATGGAICGKDLSKSDVSINIFLNLLLNKPNKLLAVCPGAHQSLVKMLVDKAKVYNELETTCAIGDETVEIMDIKISFATIVEVVEAYICICIGGFEKLAMWGLI